LRLRHIRQLGRWHIRHLRRLHVHVHIDRGAAGLLSWGRGRRSAARRARLDIRPRHHHGILARRLGTCRRSSGRGAGRRAGRSSICPSGWRAGRLDGGSGKYSRGASRRRSSGGRPRPGSRILAGPAEHLREFSRLGRAGPGRRSGRQGLLRRGRGARRERARRERTRAGSRLPRWRPRCGSLEKTRKFPGLRLVAGSRAASRGRWDRALEAARVARFRRLLRPVAPRLRALE
jgi:hypothetical protein